MLNKENIERLFKNYKDHFETLNNPEHNESYKWAAIEQVQKCWDLSNPDTSEMIKQEINAPTRDFVFSRAGDSRDRPVSDREELTAGEIFYIVCIDEPERLLPFFERCRELYHCVYQRDIYSGEQWLEIMPKGATKAAAIQRLEALTGCSRLVVFGDGMNDLEMFGIADEAYATENAVPELKQIATGVIGNNDEDAVAHWLEENATNCR